MTITTLEVAGLDWIAAASRLSHRSESDGMGPRDLRLLSNLVTAGDEHAKSLRGAMVWVRIDAPRYWWVEMDTYRVGAEQLGSESTMHDQPRLQGEELVAWKAALPEGTMQVRIWVFSYQTLRRIWLQRRYHRLPEWRQFCVWVETLPHANKLITYQKPSPVVDKVEELGLEVNRLRDENERLRGDAERLAFEMKGIETARDILARGLRSISAFHNGVGWRPRERDPKSSIGLAQKIADEALADAGIPNPYLPPAPGGQS